MADTVFTAIVASGWTQVSSGLAGRITNALDNDILFLEALADPGASVVKGHVLRPKDGFTYSLGGSQKIFARSILVAGEIVVTPG